MIAVHALLKSDFIYKHMTLYTYMYAIMWAGPKINHPCLGQIWIPEASSTIRVLVGARCSGTNLYPSCVKPGISAVSARERLHC